jgi:hypothetical protein
MKNLSKINDINSSMNSWDNDEVSERSMGW